MDLWDWLLSADVLQTLFDGLLGATVGAAVAVIVLRLTLREQRKALTEQLDKQDRHHQEQLRVQREENARARMHNSVAGILGDLIQGQHTLYVTPFKEALDALEQQRGRFAVNLELFHLDLPPDDEKIYDVLVRLDNTAYKGARAMHLDSDDAPKAMSVHYLYAMMGLALVRWTRTPQAGRQKLVAVLEFWLSYIKEHGLDAWKQLSDEELWQK